MTDEELDALPPTMDLPTAGRAFGVGRTMAYELARAGAFPCEVLPLGRRFKVTKANLFRALGRPVPAATATAAETASPAAA